MLVAARGALAIVHQIAASNAVGHADIGVVVATLLLLTPTVLVVGGLTLGLLHGRDWAVWLFLLLGVYVSWEIVREVRTTIDLVHGTNRTTLAYLAPIEANVGCTWAIAAARNLVASLASGTVSLC